MCRAACGEWGTNRARNRKPRISCGSGCPEASREIVEAECERGNPRVLHTARGKRWPLDGEGSRPADVRRSESCRRLVVCREMEIEAGRVQCLWGQRAGRMDAGEHGKTGCGKSGFPA